MDTLKRTGGARKNRRPPAKMPALSVSAAAVPEEEAEATEEQWAASIENSWDVLEELGAKATENHKQGKTLPMETILS